MAEVWRGKTFKQRLWEKIDQRGPDECWPWIGAKGAANYGRIKVNNHWVKPTRLLLQEKIGRPLRDDEMACHSCDNPPCVNPSHLWVGTAAENSADMRQKGRHPGSYRKGEANPNSRLSAKDVEEILQLKGTMPAGKIAERFGVGRTHIYHIHAGYKWGGKP